MNIVKNIKVPTGNILITQGERGLLECLSIGDYGKEKNLKADFLGLKKEINGVPHGDMLPLEEKWVITISSQYGCNMGCKFCEAPLVGKGVNATLIDLLEQVEAGLSIHSEVKYTKRLNLHYARMGEPSFNFNVLESAEVLADRFYSVGWGFHPVVSTMMPKSNLRLKEFLDKWMHFKNVYMEGDAGLQLSINTTNEEARKYLFNDSALTLEEISDMVKDYNVVGRKITLNFALSDYEIDAHKLVSLFDPQKFLCKITPMHLTSSCVDNHIITEGGYVSYYPYKKVEEDLKSVGYDVIVFVPSIEEDKSKITCGNAILSSC